jgi:hypothetical protein
MEKTSNNCGCRVSKMINTTDADEAMDQVGTKSEQFYAGQWPTNVND